MISPGGGNLRYRRGPQPTIRAGDLLPAGIMIRGGNIVPKASDSGLWKNVWANWDWTGWIKPQVDWAASIGCNTIRLIGTIGGITGASLTRSQYNTRWQQLLDYTFAQGLFIYPCGGDDFTTESVATICSEVAATAAVIDAYPHVVAYDLLNEKWGWATTGTQGLDCAGAARAVTTIPMTFSLSSGDAAPQFTGSDNYGSIAPYTDFADFHVYSEPTTLQIQSNYFNKGYGNKPLLIGEIGANLTDTTAARQTRYNNMKTLLSTTYTGSIPRLAGALAWAISDQGATTAGQWGLFDASGVERHDIGDIFATFPTS